MGSSSRRALSLLALLALALAPARARGQLVLEEATSVPGLAAGDVVLGWERRDASGAAVESGTLDDPFVLLAVLRDRLPRGGLALRGAAGPVTLPLHGASLRAEPRLPEPDLARYRAARAGLAAESEEARAAARGELEALVAAARDAVAAAAVRHRLALALEAAKDDDAAAALLAEAAAAPGLPPLPAALLRSQAWLNLTNRQLPARGIVEAEAATAALAPVAGEWPLLAAVLATERAVSLRSLGRLQEAEAGFARALEAFATFAPVSHEHGWALDHAGTCAWLADDLDLASERDRQALAVLEQLGAPTHRQLNALAIDAQTRGRWSEAEPLYHRAIAGAEDELRRALYRRNLAILYRRRGELERSATIHHELLAFYESRQDPRAAVDHAATLRSLSAIERQLGDLTAAEQHARRAVAHFEERAPGSIGAADALVALGEVLRDARKAREATAALTRALEVAERARPGGLRSADALLVLGHVALDAGELEAAAAHYARARDVARAIVPGSRVEAEALHGLGRVEAARGRSEAALERYLEAVDVLQSLRGRLGGAHEARAGFTSLHHELFWRPLDLLAASGRAADAFVLSERFRAQSFLALLAERQLDFSADLPAELDRERRRLASRYDALFGKLGAAAPEARPALRVEIDGVRQRQQELEDRIRASSPRLAELRDPRPLDAAAAAAMLPPRALLLSYVVGPERSWLFALGPGAAPLRAIAIDASAADLRQRVGRLRELMGQPAARSARLEMAAEGLAVRLLSPVADRLAAADGLVVVPDGPLHFVPWAALPAPGGVDPLVARHALSLAGSVTVLRELVREDSEAPRELVAFGDPETPPSAGAKAGALAQLALRSGSELGPLPGTRDEVRRLAAVFGEGAAVVLGREATEARLLQVAPSARRLHLACHALVDPELPLESGLVLTPATSEAGGEGGNGFLQAWEIYQRLRLDADLVTLSACESGLGREVTGEGVLGLTRAFHFAGARTVMSSLWKVSDRATAELMASFYRHLVAGRPKAEALRLAQLEVRRDEARRHPFYWAAFQIHGAWD